MSRKLQLSGSIVAYHSNPSLLLSAANSFLSTALDVHLTVIDNSRDQLLASQDTPAGADYEFLGRNVGFGAGHNIAIRRYLNSSEYHLVLNPDARFKEGVLETLYEFMQANPDVGLVMPRVLYPDGSEQLLCKLLPSPIDLLARRFGGKLGRTVLGPRMSRYQLAGMDLTRPRIVPCLSGCFMLVRTSVFRNVGLFDERYFMYLEDVDFSRRVGRVAKTVFFPGVSIYHEYKKGSYHNPLLMKYHLTSAWKYFWKWGWFIDRERDQLNLRATEPVENCPQPDHSLAAER